MHLQQHSAHLFHFRDGSCANPKESLYMGAGLIWGQCQGDDMKTHTAEDILSIEQDRVAGFIQEQANARTLSQTVQSLNSALLSKDQTASAMAAQALKHLGFVD